MSEIDRVIDGLGRISLLAQLRDKTAEAFDALRPRCGGCDHWMKSRSCPREKNVGGMSRGPSAGSPVCLQFSITSNEIEQQSRRVREATEFAERHGLPVPRFPS